MSDETLLTRREFTVESALAMLAGVTITITGCGDDDDNGTTNPTAPATDRTGMVSTDAGHSHTGAMITAAQFTAGNALTLTLTGAATHTHGSPHSSRAHTNQRGDTCAEDVVDRQRAHSHGDVQLARDAGLGMRGSGFGRSTSRFWLLLVLGSDVTRTTGRARYGGVRTRSLLLFLALIALSCDSDTPTAPSAPTASFFVTSTTSVTALLVRPAEAGHYAVRVEGEFDFAIEIDTIRNISV